MNTSLPAARAALADSAGRPTRAYYTFFQSLHSQSNIVTADALSALSQRVDQIKTQSGNVTITQGAGIRVYGSSASGRYVVSLNATTDDIPEGTQNLYFTNARAIAAAPIQSLVAGANVTIDTADPKNPVINASGSGPSSIHYDGGNAASVYTQAQHTFDGGGANG